ncbi:hypothetical protein D018_0993A, partial [Vibrio parahaemolyticus VP2007-007]
MTLFKF